VLDHRLLKTNSMKKIPAFSLLTLWLLLGGCGKKTENKPSAGPSFKKTSLTLTDQQMKFVKIDTVRLMASAEQFTAVGEVSFAEDNIVRIYPIVSGKVERVTVSLGDYVKQGTLLATLLSDDITGHQKEFRIARSNFEVEEKNFTRTQELYKSGMLSEKDLILAKSSYDNAKSELEARRQLLLLYGGADNQDALYHVYASRPGYIVERNIAAGSQIRDDNGASIFTISDLKKVWIWANVHEGDISKVHEGDEVVVRTIAYPDKDFRGSIGKINNVLDPASRVVRVRIVLDNSEGLLKPEMFATVLITPRSSEKVVVVSNNSIILENNQYYLMLETGNKEFKKVQIRTGRVFHRFTEIKEGIRVGDRVVGEGSLFVLTAYNQL